jgi:hypothetical protein
MWVEGPRATGGAQPGGDGHTPATRAWARGARATRAVADSERGTGARRALVSIG